ncbi:MAG TPA: DUF6798 domain-containing protein, partial [Tepidisphaeraceae bacterium]|nr:DUF6798 domain-containing protein [Tepidisphaeraceae bacterium]
IGYIALIALFHLAWLRVVTMLGGDLYAYLLSVLLFHLSAGGTGLGMYQFFQDSSFLPSNIASVALLWAIYFRITRKWIASATCFGIAGLFHLNYALVAVGLWIALTIWSGRGTRYWLATAIVLIPCLVNIAIVARIKLAHGDGMPLKDFIDLYVRLRHPHHYELQSWPGALWISFLWTVPLAIIWFRRQVQHNFTMNELARIYSLLWGLLIFAILGAGIWYLDESLVQMSLYRFTVYLQLFACIAAAIAMSETRLRRYALRWIGIAGSILLVVIASATLSPILAERAEAMIVLAITLIFIVLSRALAPKASIVLAILLLIAVLARPSATGIIRWDQHDDADYLAVCDWARQHTPIDSVFLVPPDETEMRLRGQRAIVVNYKCVPQLSSELPQWRDRLQDVLDLPTLLTLPHGFLLTERAIRERYDALSGTHLQYIAQKYGARYVVTTHRAGLPEWRLVRQPASTFGGYFVYDLARK